MPTNQKNVPFPSNRQRRLYSFRVSLYRPSALTGRPSSIFDTGGKTDIEAADSKYTDPPDYINVPCLYEATPEFTVVSPLGLNKEENIFTSDKWHFLADQDINDDWLIVLTACRVNTSLIGRVWTVQGNSEIVTTGVRRPVHKQWVYAKLSPTGIIPAPSEGG